MVAAKRMLLAASALVAAAAAVPEQPAMISDGAIDQALGDDEVCAGGDAVACALNALQVKAGVLAVEEEDESAGACDKGLVAQIKPLAPGCFKACPQACGPLGKAINAYMAKGGAKAAQGMVCKYKTEFSCAYKHWGECKTLAVQAGALGLKIPMSQSAMNHACR